MRAALRGIKINRWLTLACLLLAVLSAFSVWATMSEKNLAWVGCVDRGDDNFPEIQCEEVILGEAREAALSFGLFWIWMLAFSLMIVWRSWMDSLLTQVLLIAVPLVIIGIAWLFLVGVGAWSWIVAPVLRLKK